VETKFETAPQQDGCKSTGASGNMILRGDGKKDSSDQWQLSRDCAKHRVGAELVRENKGGGGAMGAVSIRRG